MLRLKPIEIEVLLKAFTHAKPEFPDTPAYKETCQTFISWDILNAQNELTSRGIVYAKAVLNAASTVPLPVWQIPQKPNKTQSERPTP